jgi:hypothetical protein
MAPQRKPENGEKQPQQRIFTFFTLFLIIGIISGISSLVLIDASNNENLSTNNIQTESDQLKKSELDKYGIKEIHTTIENGREFFSHWGEGGPRVLKILERDPIDSELILRGNNPKLTIDGNGVATMEGENSDLVSNPRIYIYDEQKQKKWNNVEVTFYQKRISEQTEFSYSGINAGTRSEHQDVTDENLILGQTYYGRFTNDGRIHFVKEIEHGNYVNSSEEKFSWNTKDGTIPLNVWVGYKFIVRTFESTGNVKLELYMDTTDGFEGGDWNKVSEFIDDGSWGGNKIYSEPATSVFLRNDGLGIAQYKNFSVREISPLS